MPSLSPVLPRPFAFDALGPGAPPVPFSAAPFESVEPPPPPEPVALAPPLDEEPPEAPPELCAMANEREPKRIVRTAASTFIPPVPPLSAELRTERRFIRAGT